MWNGLTSIKDIDGIIMLSLNLADLSVVYRCSRDLSTFSHDEYFWQQYLQRETDFSEEIKPKEMSTRE
jgi:hypothetical protein